MIWITSDTHFKHSGIIALCNRPFVDIDEMDWTLVQNWNSVVGDDDTVYHLGDFTLGNHKVADRFFSQLNGKILVLGYPWHHDRRWLNKTEYTSKSGHSVEILPPMVVLEYSEYGDGERHRPIVLCHYPIASWDKKHYMSWHLHGHSHGNHPNNGELIMDVGVDCTNFFPISMDEVAEKLTQRELYNVLGVLKETKN